MVTATETKVALQRGKDFISLSESEKGNFLQTQVSVVLQQLYSVLLSPWSFKHLYQVKLGKHLASKESPECLGKAELWKFGMN